MARQEKKPQIEPINKGESFTAIKTAVIEVLSQKGNGFLSAETYAGIKKEGQEKFNKTYGSVNKTFTTGVSDLAFYVTKTLLVATAHGTPNSTSAVGEILTIQKVEYEKQNKTEISKSLTPRQILDLIRYALSYPKGNIHLTPDIITRQYPQIENSNILRNTLGVILPQDLKMRLVNSMLKAQPTRQGEVLAELKEKKSETLTFSMNNEGAAFLVFLKMKIGGALQGRKINLSAEQLQYYSQWSDSIVPFLYSHLIDEIQERYVEFAKRGQDFPVSILSNRTIRIDNKEDFFEMLDGELPKVLDEQIELSKMDVELEKLQTRLQTPENLAQALRKRIGKQDRETGNISTQTISDEDLAEKLRREELAKLEAARRSRWMDNDD